MNFKPSKTRSSVMNKGNVADNFLFPISGTIIPTLTERPVKSLGKFFQGYFDHPNEDPRTGLMPSQGGHI